LRGLRGDFGSRHRGSTRAASNSVHRHRNFDACYPSPSLRLRLRLGPLPEQARGGIEGHWTRFAGPL